MGGNGFLTPKAIANKIKAKGLQKLRWYCQMCQKQCRDENGFKCHLKSESHLRQMAIFGQSSGKFIEGYSQEFEKTFLQHFRTAHRHTRIAANVLYNEFIADRNHIHMNATKWTTLTSFVIHLGRTGKCKVEETPKGWFITLIQKDEKELLREKLRGKRKRADESDEIRHARELKEQVERAKHFAKEKEKEKREGKGGDDGATGASEPSELRREDMEGPLEFELKVKKSDNGAAVKQKPRMSNLFEEEEEEEKGEKEEKEKGEKRGGKCWLREGIVVKIISKELKSVGYYKEKALVRKVIGQGGRFLGEVEPIKAGGLLRVDQAQLETVIPKQGGRVLVVSGAHRGSKATLLGVDTKRFKAQVEIEGGEHDRRRIWVEYDDISKASSSR